MPITPSQRVERIKLSATLAVGARAAELKAAGEDIIDLSLGEPDFDTPAHIKEAAIKAIHDGFTKYTAVDGLPKLKQAIVEKFARENQLNYALNQILVSCGAKQSFYNLCAALLNPGDEVIIPVPYWVSYPDIVLLADGLPVIIDTNHQQQFKISAPQLAAAISPKTRLVVLNSPSNPSGMTYTREELSALGEVLIHHPNIIIASDDIYEHMYWGQQTFVNIVNACPALYDRTVVINGASKAYAMTGWRIGYAAGPQVIINAMKKIQSQSTSNPNSIAQMATITALTSSQNCIKEMAAEFHQRHDYLIAEINKISGLSCLPSSGAFYAFVYAQEAMVKLNMADDINFANFLLTKAKVAVVPGSAFGSPGYIRLSYATSMNNLRKAVNNMRAVLT